MRKLLDAQELAKEDKFYNPGWTSGMGSYAISPDVPRLDLKNLSKLEINPTPQITKSQKRHLKRSSDFKIGYDESVCQNPKDISEKYFPSEKPNLSRSSKSPFKRKKPTKFFLCCLKRSD